MLLPGDEVIVCHAIRYSHIWHIPWSLTVKEQNEEHGDLHGLAQDGTGHLEEGFVLFCFWCVCESKQFGIS